MLLTASTTTSRILLHAATLATGPMGPHAIAVLKQVTPTVLITLPRRPSQKRFGLKWWWRQKPIAKARMKTFTVKIADMERLVPLKLMPDFSSVSLRISVLLAQNNIGVSMPNSTGIQAGRSSPSATIFGASLAKAGLVAPTEALC